MHRLNMLYEQFHIIGIEISPLSDLHTLLHHKKIYISLKLKMETKYHQTKVYFCYTRAKIYTCTSYISKNTQNRNSVSHHLSINKMKNGLQRKCMGVSNPSPCNVFSPHPLMVSETFCIGSNTGAFKKQEVWNITIGCWVSDMRKSAHD